MSDLAHGPSQIAGCTGPFADARDCPVHGPEIHQVAAQQQTDAIAAAERRGEARILADVAKLPSPWVMARRSHFPADDFSEPETTHWVYRCLWCNAEERPQAPYGSPDPDPAHPENDCLYARALASAPRTESDDQKPSWSDDVTPNILGICPLHRTVTINGHCDEGTKSEHLAEAYRRLAQTRETPFGKETP